MTSRIHSKEIEYVHLFDVLKTVYYMFIIRHTIEDNIKVDCNNIHDNSAND